MTGLGFDRVAASIAILFAAGPDSSMWSASLTYLLRCIGTLGFGTCRSHARDPYDNRIARIFFFGRDLSGLVQAI